MRLQNIKRLPDLVGASTASALVVASLGAGRNTVVLVGLLVGVGAFLGLDFGRTVRAAGFALVALSVTTLVLGNVRPGFEIPGIQVLALVGVFLVISYVSDALPGRTTTGGRYLIGPTFILWFFFRNLLSVDRGDALARVAGDYAEDNAAWLLGLGHSSRGASSVLSVSSNSGGGPSTGSILVFVRDAVSRVTPERIVGLADNPRVLLTSYVVTAIAGALLLAHLCEQATEQQSSWLRHSLSCLSTAMFVPFSLALMKVGHFSASVAVLFLVVAVTGAMTMRTEPPGGQTLKRFVSVTAALVAMGQAWYPLTGVAILFLLLVVSQYTALWWRRTSTSFRVRWMIPVTLVSVMVGIVVVRQLFSTYLTNITDLDYLRTNLRLVGSYAPVNPLLFVVSVLGMFIAVAVVNRNRSLLPQVVHATTLPLLVLLCVSFLMAPNTPQYGVLKAIVILSSVYVPLSSVIFLESVSSRLRPSALPTSSALIWCTMMFFSPPGNELKWLSNPGSNSNDWSEAIVKEADSGRLVVCLNTEADSTDRDYEAYLCTRIASAVATSDTYETRTWTAANICQIPEKQAREAFTSEIQSRLTVIVFDPDRLSSQAGCQTPSDVARAGWLSSIDWNRVRVVTVKGDPVVVDGEVQTSQEGT